MRSEEELRAELDSGDNIFTFKPGAKANGRANGTRSLADLIINAADLDAKHFAPVKFVVQDILPPGLVLLSAPPKIGKIWFAMGLAEAVASGGVFGGCKPADQGDVLLLDLEGNQRRAQKRLRCVRQSRPASSRLDIANEWPRMDQGGLDLIRQWCRSKPSPKLVVIDVLAAFRPPRPRSADPYQHDYETLKELHRLAVELSVTIVVVHHNRKAADADWLNEIGGTQGIAGAVDTILTIRRERMAVDAVLKVTGRDVEDLELAMGFDKETCRWSILGDAQEHAMGKTRRAIFDCLDLRGPKTPKEIAEETGLKPNTVKQRLWQMLKDSTVKCVGGGRYAVP